MFGLLAITLVAALLAPMARDGKLARNAAIGIRTRHTMLGQFVFAFAKTGAGYLAIIVLLMVSAAKANTAARGV